MIQYQEKCQIRLSVFMPFQEKYVGFIFLTMLHLLPFFSGRFLMPNTPGSEAVVKVNVILGRR